MDYKSLNHLVKFLFDEVGHITDLDDIKALFTKHAVTQEQFDGLCIYFFTQHIRLSDGYICGCSLQPLCRVADAAGMRPSEKIALYIQTRLFKCGGTSELERVRETLGIDGEKCLQFNDWARLI